MTAPDSRYLDEAMERLAKATGSGRGGGVVVISTADACAIGNELRRLQALARGPQQAGGEDWPEALRAYSSLMVTLNGAVKANGEACITREDMTIIDRYNLADEHLSMMQADRVANAEAEVARLRQARDAGADLEHDDRRDDADFWWTVAAFRAVEMARQIDRADDAEAALREAGKDTERLDWMQKHVLTQWRGSAGDHTLLDHDGHAFLGSSLRAAIDQGMRDWRSDAALCAERQGDVSAIQRDAARYRWLRDKAPDTWDVSRWLDKDTQEIHLQYDLDAAIDNAMRLVRDGDSGEG